MVTNDTDKQGFSQRLNAILDAAGAPGIGDGRQGWLAHKFDVSDKGARKWIQGESVPRFEMLNRIVDEFQATGVTIEWLLSGEPSLSPFQQLTDPTGQPQPIQRLHAWRIPIITAAHVGAFVNGQAPEYPPIVQIIQGYLNSTLKPSPKTFALRVADDTMECQFTEGMLITVEPDLVPQPGDYVVALINGIETTFRQLIKDGPDYYLKPLNSRYPIKPLGSADIIGVVREAVVRFR